MCLHVDRPQAKLNCSVDSELRRGRNGRGRPKWRRNSIKLVAAALGGVRAVQQQGNTAAYEQRIDLCKSRRDQTGLVGER